jgi:hypothetical protein
LYTENELLGLRGSLGGDSLSLENSSVVLLIIDPTATAIEWLSHYFEKAGKQATVLPPGHEPFASERARGRRAVRENPDRHDRRNTDAADPEGLRQLLREGLRRRTSAPDWLQGSGSPTS